MASHMNILLVEDNDLDVEFLTRGLKKAGAGGVVMRARDGLDALQMLKDFSPVPKVPRPFVILLDINMPRMNGHEFLAELRQTREIAHCRVVVFTTSAHQNDIDQAYWNHVSGYIVKPNANKDLNEVIEVLQQFWRTCQDPVNMMPPLPEPDTTASPR